MSCVKCRLHETCRTVKVSSRGSLSPEVFFVGEAPGSEEDQQGRAFVGPAGKLLEQAIKEYGLTPCFITNVVRCQPPGNRQPRVDEVEACLPYLKDEIRQMRPKIIVVLGNTPLKALTGMTGISTFSGTIVKRIGDISIFALYHPAYILRVPGMLPKFEMHLRELQRLIQGSPAQGGLPVLDVTPREAFDLLGESTDMVAFDYETSGLYKNQGGQVRAVGFYNGRNAFVTSAEQHSDLPKLMRWFLKSEIPKVAYNSAFEIRWSIDEYGVEPLEVVHDPMLLNYLVDENGSRDLESVASKYLKAERWDISPIMLSNGWTYETIPYENLVRYCGLDCYYTWLLPDAILRTVTDEFKGILEPYQNILLPLSRFCAQLESTGIKLDLDWAKQVDSGYMKKQEELAGRILSLKDIRAFIKAKTEQKKYFKFNLGSPMQLRELLFNQLGLSSIKKTKKGGLASTDADVMEKLKDKHEFIPLYLDWKGATTRRNNFTLKFPEFCDGAGFIHPRFNPLGTVTGRLASSNPPAHTFPRPEEDEDATNIAKVRGMVVSRFPDGCLISNDYSQLELRLLASESGEESMIEAFAKGKDLHGLTAERIFGKHYTKQQRSVGKTINFAIGYGIQAASLSRKFNVPYETAEGWIHQFWKSYRSLYLWVERQHRFVKEHGWIKSRFGRVRHLPEAQSKALEKWEMASLLRMAANFPIQSAGADINNLACIELSRQIQRGGGNSCVVLPIHDSIMVDTPKAERTQIQAICREIMEDEMQKRCPWLKVRLRIDQVTARRWGN